MQQISCEVMNIYPFKIYEIRYWSFFLSVTSHLSYVCFVKQAPAGYSYKEQQTDTEHYLPVGHRSWCGWSVNGQTEHYLPVGHRFWCGWSVNGQRQNTIYLLVIDLGVGGELALSAADGSIRLLTARVGYGVIPGQHRVIPPVPVGLEAAAFPLQRQKNTCTKVNKFGWMHTGRDIGFF